MADKSKVVGPNVGYIRNEVNELMSRWNLIKDCLGGQEAIKAAGDTYLPRPNAADISPANLARYTAYLVRAVFYGVTRRTIDGMIGQVFSRDPIVVLPEAMNVIKVNVDGTGITLDQQSKMVLHRVMSYARAGLLTDYPVTTAPVTKAEQAKGNIRSTIIRYDHDAIINWSYLVQGSLSKLNMVVLTETKTDSADGFEVRDEQRWRVLQLDSAGEYVVTVYGFKEDTNSFSVVEGPNKPKKSDGSPWTEIPFEFIGVNDNAAAPDEPPAYDLAVLNIAHYRNSADYEDACYMVGQPTPVFTGLTQQWVDQVLKGTIQLGSRAAVLLPQGASGELLQVSPNSMPFEAMKHKEAQMVALGAKLITQGAVQKTLGEAQIEESTEASVLATAAKNVATAYTKCLKWAAEMSGAPTDDIVYSLNTDFPAARLTPAERQQLVLEWQSEAITFEEMRAGLRTAGVATKDDEEARADIKKNPPPAPDAGAMNNGGNGGTRKVPNNADGTPNNGGNQSGN